MTKWYTIKASAANPKTAEVFIYGDIGESWWGDTVAAKDFVREIAALDVEALTIRVSSHGGSVTDGLAIHNAIKRHKAETTITVDSIAASITSLIVMAGDKIEMASNAMMMLHAPWGGAVGNSVEMRKYADLLDTYATAMATSYAQRSGQSTEAILALLTDGQDHWYTAEQAKAEGFVDTITDPLQMAASLDMSRYRSLPAAAAAFHKQEIPMPQIQKPQPADQAAAQAGNAAPVAVDPTAIANAALEADKARRSAIRSAFDRFASTEGISALSQTLQDDPQVTVEMANTRLLAHLAQGAASAAGGFVMTVADERDKFRTGVTAALLAKAGLAKDDTRNNYRGYTLFELARASLQRAGRSDEGLGKMEVVAAAFTHTTSDFPALLGNIAERSMMRGYDEAEETFQQWTTEGVLSDFKAAKRVDLGVFPGLEKIAEGAEYKSATIGDRGETVQLATYGRKFSITRQAIINDDLNAFSKIPRSMGRAAIRSIGDLVYAVLTGNPAMSDGTALFHASHKNLATGAGINTGSVDAMRVLMALQQDGKAILNIRLANLIVPIALEGTAKVVAESEWEVGATARNNTVPNSVRGTFAVISDARLDAASSTVWYGTASNSMFDTVEVSYLDGVKTPTLEQQNGWDVDGVEFKVRMDAGVKPLEFRTMAKNPGA